MEGLETYALFSVYARLLFPSWSLSHPRTPSSYLLVHRWPSGAAEFPVNGERRPRAAVQSGQETTKKPRVMPRACAHSLSLSFSPASPHSSLSLFPSGLSKRTVGYQQHQRAGTLGYTVGEQQATSLLYLCSLLNSFFLLRPPRRPS